MWILIIVIGLGVWAINYFTKQSDANRQARANAREMQKTFSADTKKPTSGSSSASELEKISKLHDTGALSDEEFAAAKKKILG